MAGSSNRQKELFLAALDLPSANERAAFLAEACGPDEALRRQLEAMLKVHANSDSFLEKPAAAMALTVAANGNAEPTPSEGPGTRIGPYKLLEQIGEGGMGVVFMAQQQEPVRRMVALKIIKPGMDSGQVLARFEAERQALALMDHPNIAKVLDAGATPPAYAGGSQRPFFVMELVKGTPITTFCDANKLSPRQRLELFVPVCQAIQHAHQKGVIHRDIKPSNVLIALYDDRPVPKVIDFGIAKAAGNPLTERTLHTGFGAIVGTPEYMSPEQATFNQLDIDTRSDVYSLGVLLNELLTGSTPVDKTRFKEAAILEMLRVVREEEPPRPSVKLSTTAARASIAATRGTDSDKLAQLLRGELDEGKRKLRICHAADGKEKLTIEGGIRGDLAFSPDSKNILAIFPGGGAQDSQLRVWNVETGKVRLQRDGARYQRWDADFSPDSTRFAVVGADHKTIQIWNLSANRMEASLLNERKVSSLAYGPDDQVAAATAEGVVIWNVRTGRKKLGAIGKSRLPLHTLEGLWGSYQAVFLPDGKRLLTREWTGTTLPVFKVWDIATGKELSQLHFEGSWRDVYQHGGYHLYRLVLNQDGTRLLSGNRIWDVATGQLVLILPHEVDVQALAPDGRRFATTTRGSPPELGIYEAP